MSRAADALNMAQPWLSTRIRNLEREVGFDIFDRSRRLLALTPEGEAFVTAARRFDAAAERFAEDVRAIAACGRQVELHVGCPSASSGVEERNALIAAFRERYPHVAIRIRLLSIDQIVEGLGSGRLDLGFLLDPMPAAFAGSGTIALRRQRAVILMPLAWKREGGATLALEELDGREVAVMPEAYHPELCAPIYAAMRAAGARLREMADDNFVALHAHAVNRGMAALTVDTFADTFSHFPGYGSYLLEGDAFQSDLSLVCPRPDAREAAQAFWRFASEWQAKAA